MQITQNFLVYQKGVETMACGEVDGSVRFSHVEPSTVLRWAFDQVARSGGGQVQVQPGRYELGDPLEIGDRVVLAGAGAGTALLPAARFSGEALILLKGSARSAVRSLEVSANGEVCPVGVRLVGAVDCVLEEVIVQDFPDYGFVLMEHCGCCTVKNCRGAGNGKANFLARMQQAKGRLGDFVPNLFLGCISAGGGHGFELHGTTVFNAVACVAFQPEGHGFYIHHTSNSVLVSGCRTFQCERSAVYVEDAHELNVSGNIFCWQREDGIVLNNVNWAAINGNEVIDSGVRDRNGGRRVGILMLNGTKGAQIVGNTIFNWGDQPPMSHGVSERAECAENIITGNHINYAVDAAIVSKGTGTLVKDNVVREKEAYRNMTKPAFADYRRDPLAAYLAAMKPVASGMR